MNSIDTNILLYAVHADCPEHKAAKALIDAALSEPGQWIIADQVYFELYRLLRNPAVFDRPLSAEQAADVITYYRDHSGWGCCAWDVDLFKMIRPYLREASQGKLVFDLVLSATLRHAGVEYLYTRNTKDFTTHEWFTVVNPIDRAPKDSPS